jgi:uncharacterized coiled-coil DUF342 family protein
MEERKAYQGQMEAKLQDWGSKLDEMKAKADQAGADSKAKLNKQIEALSNKRDAMQQKLAELKSSGDDAWESLKAGAESAWEDFSAAFEEAKSHFK